MDRRLLLILFRVAAALAGVVAGYGVVLGVVSVVQDRAHHGEFLDGLGEVFGVVIAVPSAFLLLLALLSLGLSWRLRLVAGILGMVTGVPVALVGALALMGGGRGIALGLVVLAVAVTLFGAGLALALGSGRGQGQLGDAGSPGAAGVPGRRAGGIPPESLG